MWCCAAFSGTTGGAAGLVCSEALLRSCATTLAKAFCMIPADWALPVNVSWKEIMDFELELLERRLTEGCNHTIENAWRQPLQLCKLVVGA